MTEKNKSGSFTLKIPLDASKIKDFKPEQEVKVIAQERDGTVHSDTVKLTTKGTGTASFSFSKKPGSMRIVLGPDTATEEELLHSQTITRELSSRQWELAKDVQLAPISIAPYYWYWWLRWCRTFTIRGRVECPDGNPVPGAHVCAFDVDLWWWWSSSQEVGCATTDETGAFEITFRWCCGYWPWWWWKLRFWRLEPFLVEKILPLLQKEPRFVKLPIPTAKPDFEIFNQLVEEEGSVLPKSFNKIDPVAIETVRSQLVERVQIIPELAHLHLWPWWPWYPWWDCTPDIIFRVTQTVSEEIVIVDENVWQTRWDIPTDLDVTLTAQGAYCLEPSDDPPGKCLVISKACNYLVNSIGGNPDALSFPKGYLSPGIGDHPFAGVIPISGTFGDNADADYYNFQVSETVGGPWNEMPPAAAGGFSRWYWGPELGGGLVGFHPVPFYFTDIDGQRVIESREHFEAQNDPASWGITRFWTNNRDKLIRWITQNSDQSLNFSDGTYYLRVRSWRINPAGHLIDAENGEVLPLCNMQDDNYIVLTIDNRVVGAGSGHPTSSDHPCGSCSFCGEFYSV